LISSNSSPMVHVLDTPAYLERHDRGGMLGVISGFPESCAESIRSTESADLGGLPGGSFDSIVVSGMGGSAMGGLLLRDWLKETLPVPMVVTRGYRLPGFVGERTLLFAVSYTGWTDEAICALKDGIGRGAKAVVFASGGEMAEIAEERGLPLVKLPGGFQPRAAIPHQFFGLAVTARRLGLTGDAWGEVDEALGLLRGMRAELGPGSPIASNPAKRLADAVKGYIPLVYGSSIHEGVAYRYSTQFNENGKSPAGAGFFPEAFHNAVMAAEAEPELLGRLCAVLIHDPAESAETAAKIGRFREIVGRRFGRVVDVHARGRCRLARILSALYIGDFASAYLGILYGRDPSTTGSIDVLKRD